MPNAKPPKYQTPNTKHMKRHCLALDLRPDPALIAEYEAMHRAVWPEILDSIRSAGILSLEIYRIENRLFMILEADDDFSLEQKAAADAANPRNGNAHGEGDFFFQNLTYLFVKCCTQRFHYCKKVFQTDKAEKVVAAGIDYVKVFSILSVVNEATETHQCFRDVALFVSIAFPQ